MTVDNNIHQKDKKVVRLNCVQVQNIKQKLIKIALFV